MNLDPEKYRTLAGAILKTRPDEIPCDDWLRDVAAYAEATLSGGDASSAFDEMRRHMDICPECAEEFAALLEALRDPG
jgi:hypothetical protein